MLFIALQDANVEPPPVDAAPRVREPPFDLVVNARRDGKRFGLNSGAKGPLDSCSASESGGQIVGDSTDVIENTVAPGRYEI
jgi:hypothetical protein